MLRALLFLIIYMFGGFMPGFYTSHQSITTSFNYASSLVVYQEGTVLELLKGDDKYQQIMNALVEITKDSHEMPAFAVSLDDETRKQMQKGCWIELIFNGEQRYNEMPFESLLIQVNVEHFGFNLIRKYNGKYQGRCFYLDLKNNMQHLHDVIISISK